MPRLSREILNQLLESHQYPCISIYMPVSPAFPDEKENDPRYRDLLKRVEQELKVGYPATEVQQLMRKCRDAVGEREFWNHRLRGLAVFCSPDLIVDVDLPRTVPEQAIVADSFHTKPLIRQLQTMDRYQVLCLTRKDVRLLEGDRDQLAEAPMNNVPRTIYDTIVPEGAPRDVVVETTRGVMHRPFTDEPGTANFQRWLRLVDHAIWENHSRLSHLPLVLCAVPENQAAFRQISKNQNLMDQGIQLDPDHVPVERIRDEAWKLMEPRFMTRIRQAIDDFRAARAHHVGDDDVLHVAKSAAFGRVRMLLVDADRHVGGKIEPETGKVLIGDIRDPMLGDLLDETAETVLRTGGEVLVMPPDMMPTDTGVAAVYRY